MKWPFAYFVNMEHFFHTNIYHLKVSNTFSKFNHTVNQNTKSLTLTTTSFLKETCFPARLAGIDPRIDYSTVPLTASEYSLRLMMFSTKADSRSEEGAHTTKWFARMASENEESYYLGLNENPVRFEPIGKVTNVFFDECNNQVRVWPVVHVVKDP